ncbi:MAG: hypothetical protein Q8R98_06500 [Rubrivivax sp.]|nr:hypothetical protein [Rubrivivax sp.]MDP3611484.1 hypothetical protein [Rubrivivax sp.]
MDVAYPYADSLSRRQLLYRLPAAPEPRRLLLVAEDTDSRSIGAAWGGPVTVMAAAELEAAPVPRGTAFDAVALPWTSGRQAAAGGDGIGLLQQAHRLLAMGGVVVGHLHNTHTLKRLVTASGLASMLSAAVRPDAMGSAAACGAALRRAGFVQAECWYVQPSIDSPMGLIPADPVAARAHFLRAIRSAQGHYSRPAYAARLLVAALGLGGMQQSELFFWATKPC